MIDKVYLDQIKQELVDCVAETPYIVPEIFIGVTDMPAPKKFVLYNKEKTFARKQRRKTISQIWNDNPDEAIKLVKKYLEDELSTFLLLFPEYVGVIEK